MKKAFTLALAIVLVLAIGIGGTLAWLTSQDTVTNTFTVGNVGITLTEPNWNTGEDEGGHVRESALVYPGEKLAKDPTVENIGANPCLVRVKVEIPTFGNPATPYVGLEGVSSEWKLHTDGYYYYMKPLAAAEKAPPVFNAVRISTAVTNPTGGTDNSYDVVVTAYAVQAQGVFPRYADVADGINDTELPVVAQFFETAFAVS